MISASAGWIDTFRLVNVLLLSAFIWRMQTTPVWKSQSSIWDRTISLRLAPVGVGGDREHRVEERMRGVFLHPRQTFHRLALVEPKTLPQFGLFLGRQPAPRDPPGDLVPGLEVGLLVRLGQGEVGDLPGGRGRYVRSLLSPGPDDPERAQLLGSFLDLSAGHDERLHIHVGRDGELAALQVDERLFNDCKQSIGVRSVFNLLDTVELPAAVAEEEAGRLFLGVVILRCHRMISVGGV